MKKIYLLFTLFIAQFVSAQTILNKPETTSRTVQDPKAVFLSQGFYAKAATVNSFIAKIGTTTEIPPTSPDNSTAGQNNPFGETISTLNGSIFHDTKGDIAVGASGQLQYTLPIALPPGIKSVAPQMNLMYSSGGGNGIAGYGWNLSGITSIARIGKNIEKDGELKGIQLDYTDYYQFNGQRLILKSGEYGKNGAEYVTEKYSNLKIKSIGAISGQTYQGPESWELTFEDGSQAWYGTNATSRTPVEYSITKWKDAQGNYITYNYTQTENVALISSIQWGGNETLLKPHFNDIAFQYDARDLKEVAYTNGVRFLQQNILKTVQVNANGTLFKKYSIAYKKDSNGTNYQYVDKITESNSQNQAANPVVFNYEQSSNSGWGYRNFTDNDNDRIVGDFDGDGNVDYLKYYDTYSQCTAYEDYQQDITDQDGNVVGTTTESRCVSSIINSAGVNLFSSFIGNSGQVGSSVGSALSFTFTKDEFNRAIAISFIDNNNQISPKQGIYITRRVAIPGSTKQNLLVEIYAIDNGVLTLKTSRTLPTAQYEKSSDFYSLNGDTYYKSDSETRFYSISAGTDIEGKGITDFTVRYKEIQNIEIGNIKTGQIYQKNSYETYFYLITDFTPGTPEDKTLVAARLESGINGDFNGDGKPDKIKFDSNGNPALIEHYRDKITKQVGYSYKNFYSDASQIPKGLRDRALLGDFNGDGKTDMFIPMAEESKDWNMYISTGTSFTEIAYPNFSYYRPFNTYEDSGRIYAYYRQYVVQDLNQDGKSDFIEFSSHCRQNRDQGNNFSEFIVNTFENKGFDSASGKYTMEKKNIDGHGEGVSSNPFGNWVNYKSYPFQYFDSGKIYVSSHASFATRGTPDNFPEPFSIMTGNFNLGNSNSQILVIKKGMMLNFSYAKIGSKINSIVQGGITTDIDYKELDPKVNPDLYAPVKKEQYPFVELDRLANSYGVAQLRQLGRKQDFKYRGAISHLQGRGMIGYRKTARSSWYADGFDKSKIWSVSEIDPLNNGVPIKEWSTRDESAIFPASDVSESTAGLLSYKKTDYTSTKLLSGVEALVATQTLQKDFLTQVTTTNTTVYNNYYLPIESTTNINNSMGIKTTKIGYSDNPTGEGNNFYIGRVISKEESVTAYGDTKKSKQEYTFENNLVKTIKSYNNDGTGFILDTFINDGFGNTVEKQTTNSVDAQTQNVKTEFEPKGRFVIKKTDNLGLEAVMTYNDWGQMLTQRDPLGNTITNTYDGWGKLVKSKDNLTGYTTYKYEKSSFNTFVTKYTPEGNIEMTATNPKGETYLTRTKAFNNGQYVDKQVQYDILGRKTSESEPYLVTMDTPKWNTIAYDESVFPPKATATAFNGKQMETKIEGNTTITTELNGYARVTKKTTDALGNVVQTEDKGGIIKFTYNAAGQNLTATYGSNVVTTTYDNWGRKASFNDPSNGLYSYTYHGFGQLKKETSPKGYKEYAYNNLGQLITQTEKSSDVTSTNKNITFTYDNKGRITSRQGTSNGKAYSSTVTYDAQGRVIASGENSNNRYFLKKNVIYDDKGRVTSYEKALYSGGTYTQAIIENVYSPWSGDLQQVKDKNTQKALWQLDLTKANGQVLNAKLGATNIWNSYDSNNFLTSVNHTYQALGQTAVTNVLGLGYTFDAIKNELKQRTRTGFVNLTENFVYDDNNRLLNWTNPKTGQLSNNVYDDKGRITQNDQLGKVNYNRPNGNVYQASSIEPNANLAKNWPDKESILQKITYNENNDPIYLDGKNGDYAFEYGLNESRQVMYYGGNFDPALASQQAKFAKYYSEDGSYEVVLDKTTGQEKHLLYIGGTPYESNIVLLKNFTETTAKFVFLHKDYLGTILAISNEQGQVLEQRHFDAWGVMTNYLNINGVATPPSGAGGLLIDRGYTSHEHLQDVGIIHMNGRLYDPLMRRFLNADENIQDPYNTQNYNKYGYVMNNPLLFNDPSGEIFFFVLLAPMIGNLIAGVIAGAIAGTIVAATTYALGAAISGYWNWSAFGRAVIMGAVMGGITGGMNPGLFSNAAGTLLRMGGQVISSLLPSETISIGDFDFSISPSIALGKGWGFGANISATFHAGDFSLSAGIGIMSNSNYNGLGKNGLEIRKSILASYDDGKYGISLGSNLWSGKSDMKEFSQQTGTLGLHFGDFRAQYENDGKPFSGISGDGNDQYRTAALSLSVGEFSAGFNLFTGQRDKASYKNEKSGNWDGNVGEIGSYKKGSYGEHYKNGFVDEKGTPYRLGAAYFGYQGYRIGTNSEWIRHAIQNVAIHGTFIANQRMFPMQSGNWSGFSQYKTPNTFTSW
jgi:RHS repeat-associated protein